jgi:Cytochrome bd terminal oxidase subunit I
MEFQFGTNWSHFSGFAGGVIGQTLAMEGVFAFFLESAFLGLLLYGEKRLGPWAHWWSAVAVFLGSWLSGFFIISWACSQARPLLFIPWCFRRAPIPPAISDDLQQRRRPSRPERRPYLVDSRDDSRSRLLHPAVSHVQGQGAAGGGRLLIPDVELR